MILGVVGSNSQKCPIIFFAASKQVNADVYHDRLPQHVVPLGPEDVSGQQLRLPAEFSSCQHLLDHQGVLDHLASVRHQAADSCSFRCRCQQITTQLSAFFRATKSFNKR
jgi:hypothetical protein